MDILTTTSLAICLNFVFYSSNLFKVVESSNVLPDVVKQEIIKTFPGVSNETLLIDFLHNASYVEILMSVQMQMCYTDLLDSHSQSNHRTKRGLFPKDFWETDVHHGYYHYLKHLDPRRWWDEGYGYLEIKSSLPPLYYVAKYCPEEIRFLKDNDYHEEYYPNLTWPPGLDPFWTGDPNKTTNLFTEVTSSSSSESLSWEPYSGESTTTANPFDKK